MRWLFEDGTEIKLPKKQHLFLSRGTRLTRHFSFPAALLTTLHRKLLQNGYSLTEEDMKTCAFVLDIKGLRLPSGDWVKFNEDNN